MWDLIVSVSDHCLSFYYVVYSTAHSREIMDSLIMAKYYRCILMSKIYSVCINGISDSPLSCLCGIVNRRSKSLDNAICFESSKITDQSIHIQLFTMQTLF